MNVKNTKSSKSRGAGIPPEPVKKGARQKKAAPKKKPAVKKKAAKKKPARKPAARKTAKKGPSVADQKRMRVARIFWSGAKPVDAYREVYPASLKWKPENVATEAYRTLRSKAAQEELARLKRADEIFAVASHDEVMRFNTDVLRGNVRQVVEVVVDEDGNRVGEKVREPSINERMRSGREILKYAAPAEGGGDGPVDDNPAVFSCLDDRLKLLRKKLQE